jgi:hypothetical protein
MLRSAEASPVATPGSFAEPQDDTDWDAVSKMLHIAL